jgi:hypothetical protein
MTETVDENAPYPPYAGLYLTGKELDPKKITDILGINPHKSWKRGDKRKDNNARTSGLWMIDSSGQVQSVDFIAHLEWLVENIEPVATKLSEILQDENINAVISGFWIMPTSHEYLILDPNLSKRVAAINLRLEISIYSPG